MTTEDGPRTWPLGLRLVVGAGAAWALLLWFGLFFVVPLIGDGPGPGEPPPLAFHVETFVITAIAGLLAGVAGIALRWAIRQAVPRRARWLYPVAAATTALVWVAVAELT